MTAMFEKHRLALAQIVLSAAGVAVAAILTSFHYSPQTTAALCTGAGGCEAVNTSPYSTVAGIPIALIGLGAYVVIGALACWSTREGALAEQAPLAVFGLSLVGVLYSLYLTYLELFVIREICPWCVASAVLITAIWVLAVVDLVKRRQADVAEADA
ncbi:MAG TPA: vitamin K epoxide reductase family protein [Anaerolineae bacterium]|nr:vitamin K epoxide reductase family protein [Anaerolineae bacterium]